MINNNTLGMEATLYKVHQENDVISKYTLEDIMLKESVWHV